LIPPQNVAGTHEKVESFMRPAPHANEDETQCREDAMVLDPLSNEVVDLWQGTAKRNRDIFTEVFRPVPSDLVHNWDAYKVRLEGCA
jgi:phospholipase D1/2